MTATKPVLVLNGPNLNTLGTRNPEVNGTETLADIEASCRNRAQQLGIQIAFAQSNPEGELVETIQQAREQFDAIVINAGAYTHTSVAIHDALEYAQLPVVEVHISNVYRRESFRHTSFISPLADAVIAGAGTLGYELALEYLARSRG